METHPKAQILNTPIEKFMIGDNIWKFVSPWYIKTPPGYSCLFTSPMYQENIFEILPAVVDTDKHHMINFPFKFKGQDGKYIVSRDTPLVQIIPFKRDEWKSQISAVEGKSLNSYYNKVLTKLSNYYRDYCYSKKKYR